MAVSGFAASAGGPAHVSTVVRADEKSGHLVRSMVVAPGAAEATADLVALVDRIALAHGVEESLVHSVIRVESNYNPYAVSPKGAEGIMQLIPVTARRFGVNDVFNPRENIEGGVRYLKFLLDYYRGDYTKVIAGYNAGEAAVDKYNGVPPYVETRNYVSQVARNLTAARQKRAGALPSAGAWSQVPESGKITEATFVQPLASVGSDGRIYYRTP
jgi:soluble lytic murein transglycosylase-like protein